MEIPPTHSISFEQAIEVTQSLLAEVEHHRVSETELESIITALVQSENGARGFFVNYLTDDRDFADQPSQAVIQALQSSPSIVGELLVKNLAMSTGMILTHLQNQNSDLANGSERVQRRTKRLVELTRIPMIFPQLQQLKATIETGNGEYESFLKRWGYDSEQREAIRQQAEALLDRDSKTTA